MTPAIHTVLSSHALNKALLYTYFVPDIALGIRCKNLLGHCLDGMYHLHGEPVVHQIGRTLFVK